MPLIIDFLVFANRPSTHLLFQRGKIKKLPSKWSKVEYEREKMKRNDDREKE